MTLHTPELSIPDADGADDPVRQVVLGAPGVYLAPEVPARRLAAEPMDVVGFVGVTPRGPAFEPVDDPTLRDRGITHARSVPVTVDSWDEYQEAFGGFSGPGLLPHAVAAFFAQGGRRAVVVRIVSGAAHRPAAVPPGCAHHDLGSGVPPLRARSEGAWGNGLRLTLSFTTRALAVAAHRQGALVLAPGSGMPVGTLLRLRTPGRADALAVVTRLEREGRRGGVGSDLVATLDRAVVTGADTVTELVEGELTVVDTDPERPRRERFTGLGMRPAHPRYLADVLRRRSRLLAPLERPLTAGDDVGFDPAPTLPTLVSGPADPPGFDRFALVTEDDVLGDPVAADLDATAGIGALGGALDAATVVVPDLYALPTPPLADPDVVPGGDPAFRPCADRTLPPRPRPPASGPLTGLALDPTDPDDLAGILARQARLVAAAPRLELVALLDVPPGLTPPQVLRWRAAFDSTYAAAYHPWLRAPGPDPDGPLSTLPPSAVAAGVLARTELARGISRAPANEVAAGVVDVAEPVDDEEHATLHRLGVDVFRALPGGVFLTAARTLSADPVLRQLTARRLLLLVRRTVRRQLAWTAFEPDSPALRAGLRRHLEQLLGALFDGGAFAGATAEESWFVRIAESGATPPGQVVVEIGMAPSAPLEFVVVRVALDVTGANEPVLDLGEAVVHDG
ncbi:phage tail sheath subtilisin-like domain-containing protein [Pseudonocardia lacus]|uniref:phage tail sheath subtilisin-like domain-containing protein n=1 Tax=Pseudonocardia lacus TaxID=2835865 RepID=UPI001BDCFCDC|nr:phage tail sheath subtilisin-like domain-containing protein [Pseudonocardia lacus]